MLPELAIGNAADVLSTVVAIPGLVLLLVLMRLFPPKTVQQRTA